MTAALEVLAAPPVAALQDAGRQGARAFGVSRGGAADPRALTEAAALLSQPLGAALELAGPGARFRARGRMRVALTGAPMGAAIDGRPVRWMASHLMEDGAVLSLGAAGPGVYGYLSVGGGFDVPPVLNSLSVNTLAGIGAAALAGDLLPLGPDPGLEDAGFALPVEDRFSGGVIRVLDGPQTALFDPATRERFYGSDFTADPRSNRQGVRLARPGAPFQAAGQLSILSESIVPGDIQMTGDGTPYVLMPDCQTTGGYPRIGTVHPDDLARVAQAAPGLVLRFRQVDRDEALAAFARAREAEARLRSARFPLIRDPADVKDLLSYQLISGATTGRDAI
ncbi:MAG: urea amidolyase [Rhodobacteraceae bacterium]|nr:urea amidolyase [Paracoccaceae bacterium]